LSFMRFYTSLLQTCRCPSWVQVGALFVAMCTWRVLSHKQYISYSPGPNGTFYTDHGLPWMDRPPYLGYILHGNLFIILPYLFSYNFAYHYLRHLWLVAKRVAVPPVLAIFGSIVGISLDMYIRPSNNLMPRPPGWLAPGVDGTPPTFPSMVCEILLSWGNVFCVMVIFYRFVHCRPLELLGKCVLPTLVTHEWFYLSGAAFCRSLPRVHGLEGLSAVVSLTSVFVGYMALCGLAFHGTLWTLRWVWKTGCASYESPGSVLGGQFVPQALPKVPSLTGKSDDGDARSLSGSTQDTLSVRSA